MEFTHQQHGSSNLIYVAGVPKTQCDINNIDQVT